MTTTAPTPRPLHRRNRRAFTLLETALALVIVMVGVLAIVDAQRSMVRVNAWSSHESTATYLANEVRERMRTLPRHDPVGGLFMSAAMPPVLIGWGRETSENLVTDFDDIDDYDGVRFGSVGGTGVNTAFDGPIDAFGNILYEVDDEGRMLTDANGDPMPLVGWAQTVRVEKVNPYDYTTTRTREAVDAANGTFPGRAVDQFPLRVTVTVWYREPEAPQPDAVTTMQWIVPASQ